MYSQLFLIQQQVFFSTQPRDITALQDRYLTYITAFLCNSTLQYSKAERKPHMWHETGNYPAVLVPSLQVHLIPEHFSSAGSI